MCRQVSGPRSQERGFGAVSLNGAGFAGSPSVAIGRVTRCERAPLGRRSRAAPALAFREAAQGDHD